MTMAATACVSRKVAERAEEQRDSLERVVVDKDSLLEAVFADINSISENLEAIKTREKVLTLDGTGEGAPRPVDQIQRDIATIDRLLQENKARVVSLQRTAAQLRKANLRIEGLEKTVADLQTRLGEKGEEIVALKEQLDRREAEVAELQERVEVQNERIEELASETSELQGRMNTVYYIVGSERELRNAQIIDKQGFIGRTVTLAKGGNLDCFTRADARLLEELPIGHKRVQVVTSHPEDSYRLVTGADKVVASLVILDPERFWESSRILVVAYR